MLQKLSKITGLFTLFLLVSTYAFSQGEKRVLAEADKFYKYGDYYTAAKLYEQYLNPSPGQKPKNGLPVYRRLVQSKSKKDKKPTAKVDVLYKLANAYRLAYYYPQAATQYKACYTEDPGKYGDSYYWYAVCMRSVGNYAEARIALNQFLQTYASNNPLKSDAEAEAQTLDFIEQQLKRPDTVLYVVNKADQIIGVEKGIYAAASGGDTNLIITSTIKDTLVKKNKNPYRNRLFTAAKTNDQTIQSIELLPIDDLDKESNQGTASLHPNGNLLYFTEWIKTKDKSVASIVISKKKDGKWQKPEKLAIVNSDSTNSKQPTISGDGSILYFASDRAGGLGGYDLWSVALDQNGMPVNQASNLGKEINTSGEEQAPYYHAAENVLVFATNERPGMGGFDLFMSKNNGTEWSSPINLGYPVNSTRDDIYFFTSGKDLYKNAYLSSDRGSNCCLETYYLDKLPKRKRIIGQLLTCNASEPIPDAEVELNAGSGNKLRTDDQGKFSYELKEGDLPPSEIVFSKDSFIAKTANYKVIETNEQDPLTNIWVHETICLDKVEIIKPENISPIYFDFDKSLLRKEGKALLDSVYDVLNNNPSYTIKVDAHTDSKGSDAYNIKLSQRRAKAVVDYLVKKGVAEARITREAFGKSVLAEDDMPNGVYDPEAAQKNRRALIHITKP